MGDNIFNPPIDMNCTRQACRIYMRNLQRLSGPDEDDTGVGPLETDKVHM